MTRKIACYRSFNFGTKSERDEKTPELSRRLDSTSRRLVPNPRLKNEIFMKVRKSEE